MDEEFELDDEIIFEEENTQTTIFFIAVFKMVQSAIMRLCVTKCKFLRIFIELSIVFITNITNSFTARICDHFSFFI